MPTKVNHQAFNTLLSNNKNENLSRNRQWPPLDACRIAIIENVATIMTLHLIPYPHSTGFVHVCDDTERFPKLIIFKDHHDNPFLTTKKTSPTLRNLGMDLFTPETHALKNQDRGHG
jgi:hypothetical protein